MPPKQYSLDIPWLESFTFSIDALEILEESVRGDLSEVRLDYTPAMREVETSGLVKVVKQEDGTVKSVIPLGILPRCVLEEFRTKYSDLKTKLSKGAEPSV